MVLVSISAKWTYCEHTEALPRRKSHVSGFRTAIVEKAGKYEAITCPILKYIIAYRVT